jgi:hypothetical protein
MFITLNRIVIKIASLTLKEAISMILGLLLISLIVFLTQHFDSFSTWKRLAKKQ